MAGKPDSAVLTVKIRLFDLLFYSNQDLFENPTHCQICDSFNGQPGFLDILYSSAVDVVTQQPNAEWVKHIHKYS